MICVVGFGNLLLGDDGVGIRIIQRLKMMDLPSQVDIIDAGVYGAILFSLVEKYNKIIVVDAFRSNCDIENILFMKASHIIKEKEKYYFSGHDLSLFDIFSMMKSVYSEEILDNICIMGIRIHKIDAFATSVFLSLWMYFVKRTLTSNKRIIGKVTIS